AGLSSIGNRVDNARFAKGAQPQGTRITVPTGFLFRLIAGPGELKRRIQLQPTLYDVRFAHVNYRRDDLNVSFRFCAGIDYFLKSIVKLRSTIRVARRVFGNSSDVYAASTNHFRPARRN